MANLSDDLSSVFEEDFEETDTLEDAHVINRKSLDDHDFNKHDQSYMTPTKPRESCVISERKSLKSFRQFYRKFLGRRFRPSCLKSDNSGIEEFYASTKISKDLKNTGISSRRQSLGSIASRRPSFSARSASVTWDFFQTDIADGRSRKSFSLLDSSCASCQTLSEAGDLPEDYERASIMSRRRRVLSTSGMDSPLTRHHGIDKQLSMESTATLPLLGHSYSRMRPSTSQDTLLTVDKEQYGMSSNAGSRLTSPSTSCENLCDTYRQTLSCVINPLGCPDERPGCSPSELAEHVKEIFQVEPKLHHASITELRNQKQSNVVVNVQVIEAKDLRPCVSEDHTNPYCVVVVDELLTPRSSPPTSPRTSPTSRRKSGNSLDAIDDLNQTEPQKSTTNPQWNEQFEISVKDLNSESLHVLILNSSTQSSRPEVERCKLKDRRASFKGLLRHIRSAKDSIRGSCNHLGQLRVPLAEIPVGGCDTWFQLSKCKRHKFGFQGQIRLRLQLSYKHHNPVNSLGPSLPECSITEYYEVVTHVYRHAFNISKSSPGQKILSPPLHVENHARIPDRSRLIMNQFAVQNHISHISQKIIELAAVLHMKVTESCSYLLTDKLLDDLVDGVKHEFSSAKSLFLFQSLETERSLLSRVVGTYLCCIQDQISFTNLLFPPTEIHLRELDSQIGISSELLSLPIWNNCLDSVEFQTFSSVFLLQIQSDVEKWILPKLEAIICSRDDDIVRKTKDFLTVLQEVITILKPITSISEYFQQLGVDYFKVVSFSLESKISSVAQDLAAEMDKYQIKYHRFEVNIRDSSVVSLQLYFTLRTLLKTIETNVKSSGMCKVSLIRYQDWFKGSVSFWLQTFREECQKRMEKALWLDKDVVQISAEVKYSNSSVDILSLFSKTISEWEQIGFDDVDIQLLGVTKLTDMICDCIKMYADKVIVILEQNGYYEYLDKNEFDITDQLCITLNNVSHLNGYLVELSTLLNWDSVAKQLNTTYENEDVGKMALRTLESIVTTTNDEMMQTGRILAQQIIQRMAVNLEKYTKIFALCTDKCGNCEKEVEPLLDYLESNLQVLYKKLEAFIFPLFLQEIWRTEIKIFSETVLEGQCAEYYQKMLMHMRSLKSYFHTGGAGALMASVANSQTVTVACKIYIKLLKTLEINAMTSEALILEYYKNLVNSAVFSQIFCNLHVFEQYQVYQQISSETTPSEYYGHLTVKVGFRQETEGFVTVHAKVVQARHLPGMSSKDLSNPVITLTLCPLTVFKNQTQQKTSIKQATINPIYGEVFEFYGISNEALQVEGAVMVFSVWHHVSLLPNDFLGEVVVPLSRLREITAHQGVDDLPALIAVLRRPREPRDGPFKILKERSVSDKVAEQVIDQRTSIITFHTRCRLCKPVKCIVSTITGKKLEVIGKRDSICTIEE